MEKITLYPDSYAFALQHGEEQKWKASLQTNQIVSVYLDAILEQASDENEMDQQLRRAIEEHGAERIGWILANAVQKRYWNREIDGEARLFAAFQRIPFEKQECGDWYILSAAASKINQAIRSYRRQMKVLDVKTSDDVLYASELHSYRNQLVLLRPSALQKDCCRSKYQYFIAKGGNGCEPDRFGRNVYGEFLIDGEEGVVNRSQIFGIANEKCMEESLLAKWHAYLDVQSEETEMKWKM